MSLSLGCGFVEAFGDGDPKANFWKIHVDMSFWEAPPIQFS
jgi:hypothetical protein